MFRRACCFGWHRSFCWPLRCGRAMPSFGVPPRCNSCRGIGGRGKPCATAICRCGIRCWGRARPWRRMRKARCFTRRTGCSRRLPPWGGAWGWRGRMACWRRCTWRWPVGGWPGCSTILTPPNPRPPWPGWRMPFRATWWRGWAFSASMPPRPGSRGCCGRRGGWRKPLPVAAWRAWRPCGACNSWPGTPKRPGTRRCCWPCGACSGCGSR